MSLPSFRCRTQTVNTVEAIWMKSPSEVEDEKYDEFYQFIAKAFDKPLAKVGGLDYFWLAWTPACVFITSCIYVCCTLGACSGVVFSGMWEELGGQRISWRSSGRGYRGKKPVRETRSTFLRTDASVAGKEGKASLGLQRTVLPIIVQ